MFSTCLLLKICYFKSTVLTSMEFMSVFLLHKTENKEYNAIASQMSRDFETYLKWKLEKLIFDIQYLNHKTFFYKQNKNNSFIFFFFVTLRPKALYSFLSWYSGSKKVQHHLFGSENNSSLFLEPYSIFSAEPRPILLHEYKRKNKFYILRSI